MSELLGFAIALCSTLLAGVVSGLRLKPYIDAGAVYTPPTFALYPALIATGFSVVLVLVFYQWQRKSTVHMGQVRFTGKQFFAFVWCLFYILVAIIFFPYRPPLMPQAPQIRTNAMGQRVAWYPHNPPGRFEILGAREAPVGSCIAPRAMRALPVTRRLACNCHATTRRWRETGDL